MVRSNLAKIASRQAFGGPGAGSIISTDAFFVQASDLLASFDWLYDEMPLVGEIQAVKLGVHVTQASLCRGRDGRANSEL